jgi:hypothetical protein
VRRRGAGDVRSYLIAMYRRVAGDRRRGEPRWYAELRRRARTLERGGTVVVATWALPHALRPPYQFGCYVQVERDGSLTPVRPVKGTGGRVEWEAL